METKAIRLANFVLICAVLAAAAFLAYSFIEHKYLISRLYWIVPGAVLVLSLLSLKLKVFLKINIALLLLSTAMIVYGGNFILAFAATYQAQKSIITARNEKLGLISVFAERGAELYPFFSSNELLIDNMILSGIVPLGGISEKITILGNESGEWALYESDEHGFNNPKGIWESDFIDIISVGDSYVQGLTVGQGKDISSQLRRRYPNTLNLGYAGNGPLRELAAIREYANHLQPTTVLWFFFENDLNDLQQLEQNSLFSNYLLPEFTQGLLGKQSHIDSCLLGIVNESLKKELEAFGRSGNANSQILRAMINRRFLFSLILLNTLRSRFKLLYPRRADLDTELELYRNILVVAQRCISSFDGKLYFVYLPSKSSILDSEHCFHYRDDVLSAVESLDIPIIDMQRVFLAESKPLALFPESRIAHYNEEGYKLVADTILDFLEGTVQ